MIKLQINSRQTRHCEERSDVRNDDPKGWKFDNCCHMVLTGCLITLLAACSSDQKTEFYTLQPVAEAAASPREVKPVALGDFQLPETLNRLQIVRAADNNQVNISDIHRWAAPLDDMSRRVLSDNLERLLPPKSIIVSEGAQYDTGIDVITVQADSFGGDFAGHVTLDAHWTIATGEPAKALARSSEQITEQAVDGGYPAMVTAMNKALADLAISIAAQIPPTTLAP